MFDALALLYFLASYTLGAAAAQRVRSVSRRAPGRGAGYLLPLGVLMMAIVGVAMGANFTVLRDAPPFRAAAPYGMILCAIALSFLTLRAFAEALPSAAMRRAAAANSALCLATFAVLSACAALGRVEPARSLALALKDAALLAAALASVAARKEAALPASARFLRAVGLAALPALPILIVVELGPPLGILAWIGAGAGLLGPWLLPGILAAWSLGILRHFRRPPAAPAAGIEASFPGLSGRELEVAALLLEGKPYKRIAGLLSISMPTVKSHVGAIYRKTGAANRLDLAAKAGIMGGHTKG